MSCRKHCTPHPTTLLLLSCSSIQGFRAPAHFPEQDETVIGCKGISQKYPQSLPLAASHRKMNGAGTAVLNGHTAFSKTSRAKRKDTQQERGPTSNHMATGTTRIEHESGYKGSGTNMQLTLQPPFQVSFLQHRNPSLPPTKSPTCHTAGSQPSMAFLPHASSLSVTPAPNNRETQSPFPPHLTSFSNKPCLPERQCTEHPHASQEGRPPTNSQKAIYPSHRPSLKTWDAPSQNSLSPASSLHISPAESVGSYCSPPVIQAVPPASGNPMMPQFSELTQGSCSSCLLPRLCAFAYGHLR